MIGAALRTLVRRHIYPASGGQAGFLAQVADVTLAGEPSVISAAIPIISYSHSSGAETPYTAQEIVDHSRTSDRRN